MATINETSKYAGNSAVRSNKRTQIHNCRWYERFTPRDLNDRQNKKSITLSRREAREIKAQLQMFEGVKKVYNDIQSSADSLRGFTATLSEAGTPMLNSVVNIENISDSLKNAMHSVQSILGSVSCKIGGSDVVQHLLSLIDILVNVAFADPACRLKSFFWNLFTKFGYNIYQYVVSMCAAPKQSVAALAWNEGVENFVPGRLQMLDGITGLLGHMSSIPGAVQGSAMSVPVVGALLACVLQASMGLPQKAGLDNAIEFFGKRMRNMKFMCDFATSYHTMFNSIAEWLMEVVLGKSAKAQELDSMMNGFEDWATQVQELNDSTEPLAIRIERDEKLFYKIDSLYKRSIQFANDIALKRVDSKLTIYYHKLAAVVEAARRLCDYTGVFGNKPRMEPLVIQLFGESGVGKSGMAWPLAVDLNAIFMSTVEEARDFAKEVYFRNVEQEFWDGYTGQNIVCYDDFGQRADSQTAPNEEFMELIRASNLAPYPLHMAELAEKKRTKFNSKAMILTCNVLTQNVSSLTFPDAYRRRIDICAKVTNKGEYVKTGFSAATGTITSRLDATKCDGPVDTNCYELVLYDAETMQPMTNGHGEQIVLDYNQFLIKCIQSCKRKMANSKGINEALEQRVDGDRFSVLKAHFQINDLSWKEKLAYASLSLREYYSNYVVVQALSVKQFVANHILHYRQVVQDQLSSFTKFRALLLTVGVVLAGLGIWKLFSKKVKNRKYRGYKHEAFGSGDNQTKYKTSVKTEAAMSGDNVTRHSGPIVCMEASTSGDHKTNHGSSTHVEASASGDHITRVLNVNVVEAASSGDHNTPRSNVVRTEATLVTSQLEIPTESNLQAWKDATAQDLISTRILSNMYKISRARDGQALLNGIFIRDTIMLVPRHLRLGLKDTDIVILENIFGSRFELPMTDVEQVSIVDSQGGEKDAMLFRFPRYVNAHSDIVKHFQTMPELAHRRANVALATIRTYNNKIATCILGNTQATMTTVTLSTDSGVHHIRDAIQYDLNTTDGDCGAPVICQDNSFIRKIAGIHIAAANDGTRAFAQSVSQQDLLRALAHFTGVIITDSDSIANISVCDSRHQLNMNVPYYKEDVQSLFDLAADTFAYVGKCLQPLFSPSKTDLLKSVIHGEVTQPTTKPALLFHKEVNMLNHNLKKCGVNTPYISKIEIDRAVSSYKPILLSRKIKELARILTYEEAISGSTLSTFLAGITRKSSPGYPYVLNRPSGKPGKTAWFGDSDDYVYDPDVRERVYKLAILAKQGKRTPYVWSDTLKDERRPNDKVDALKTRVFASGPQDYLLLFRQYFLGFVANTMENRIDNEQSIGTNPFNNDWTRTAKKLSCFGDQVFAGDFSTFDGTLNSCIMHSFVDVINEWYNDGPENATLRHTLFLDIMNSVHLSGSKFYACTHSQPSGNPLTTILNSWYNSVSMRIAFNRCAEKHNIKGAIFNKVVSMVSYGDDNVINFDKAITPWFNQVEVTEAYASFGMIYTDEAKTGNITPFKTLSECAYLKRGFRYEDGRWFAPLDFDVCMEMCNWIRKSPDPIAATCDNVENACRELSVHGRSVFDTHAPRLVQAFYGCTGEYPDVKSYAEYFADMNES